MSMHPLLHSPRRRKLQTRRSWRCCDSKKSGTPSFLSVIRQPYLFARLILILLVVATVTTTVVYSKEIVAKHDEWTRIGENDTVDSGMHIRIDMTTGEKWVKQIEADDDKTKANHESKISSSAIQVVSTEAQGEEKSGREQKTQAELNLNGESSRTVRLPKRIIYRNNEDDTTTPSSSETQMQHEITQEPQYDYDMMYRTLSKLPIDEQERMHLPSEYVAFIADENDDSMSSTFNSTSHRKNKRQQFETSLRYIWEQRQQELLDLEIADLPQILKEYINVLQSYNIHHQFLYDDDNSTQTLSNHQPNNSTNNITTTHPYIISILKDLEYQLQDIDLTRDFHTLNGWNTLVSLLSLRANVSSSTTQPNDTTTLYQHHEVQMYTAWVIGTALKHIPEFHPYAIEPIRLRSSSYETTTTLDLVLQQIQTSYRQYSSQFAVLQWQSNNRIATSDESAMSKLLQTKLLRFIYCFGSLLRGNYNAQQYVLNSVATLQEKNDTTNLLKQFMNDVLVSSLQQIHHQNAVPTFTSNHDSSNSTSMELQLQHQYHIDFLHKFVQRSLNVILDCLNEIRMNIGVTASNNDTTVIGNGSSKWDLQNTDPVQFQQLQTIYQLWQAALCRISNRDISATTDTTATTTVPRLLKYQQNTSSTCSSIIDLMPFLSSSDTDLPSFTLEEELDNDPNSILRATIASILDHCQK